MNFNIVFPMSSEHMTNGFIPQSSILLGIIPALILLYYSLKGWHGKFTEKTLFIMFILGIIMGFLVAITQTQILFTIEVLIIYPFLEQIVKVIVLNLRRFHDKQSTVLYGLAIGLGFGSIYPPASMLLLSNDANEITIILTLIGSIGLVFIHGATGALIGYGIYQGKLPKFYLFTVLILILANMFKIENFQWLNIILGIFLYIYFQRNIMKKVLTTIEKRKRTHS